MRDRFLMLASEPVPNGWTSEGHWKAGGFKSRFFIKKAILRKSC